MIDGSDPLEVALAVALGLGLALIVTPVAIRVGRRTGLLDHPRAWKRHSEATPYLGGVAVLLSAAAAATLLVAPELPLAVLAGVAALTGLGLLDDFRTLRALPRLSAEVAAAALLWQADLGWQIGPDPLALAVTCGWVVVVINAVNLLDLMDGAAGSSLAAAAAATAALALTSGNQDLAVALAAMTGALLGFLRFNLASPRGRIFLGDGGTMSLGFLLAAAIPAACDQDRAEQGLVAGCLLLSFPLLDAVVRSGLRMRRGVSLMTPGHDSLANRLLDRLGSTRRVALAIFGAQAISGAIAVTALEAAPSSLVLIAAAIFALGLLAAAALQAPPRRASAAPAEGAGSSPVIRLASTGAQRSRE